MEILVYDMHGFQRKENAILNVWLNVRLTVFEILSKLITISMCFFMVSVALIASVVKQYLFNSIHI